MEKKEGFQKHETSDSQMEAVARYVTAPSTVIGGIGDLLYERHALEKSENRKNELLEAMALGMIRQISADESRKRLFFCGHLISFIRSKTQTAVICNKSDLAEHFRQLVTT